MNPRSGKVKRSWSRAWLCGCTL